MMSSTSSLQKEEQEEWQLINASKTTSINQSPLQSQTTAITTSDPVLEFLTKMITKSEQNVKILVEQIDKSNQNVNNLIIQNNQNNAKLDTLMQLVCSQVRLLTDRVCSSQALSVPAPALQQEERLAITYKNSSLEDSSLERISTKDTPKQKRKLVANTTTTAKKHQTEKQQVVEKKKVVVSTTSSSRNIKKKTTSPILNKTITGGGGGSGGDAVPAVVLKRKVVAESLPKAKTKKATAVATVTTASSNQKLNKKSHSSKSLELPCLVKSLTSPIYWAVLTNVSVHHGKRKKCHYRITAHLLHRDVPAHVTQRLREKPTDWNCPEILPFVLQKTFRGAPTSLLRSWPDNQVLHPSCRNDCKAYSSWYLDDHRIPQTSCSLDTCREWNLEWISVKK